MNLQKAAKVVLAVAAVIVFGIAKICSSITDSRKWKGRI